MTDHSNDDEDRYREANSERYLNDDTDRSAGISRLFLVKEAVHSVSMEHAAECDCTTCRAADGDDEAFGKILRSFDTEADR